MAVFDAEDVADFRLLQEIMDYCLDYPDARHHPKEDAIYAVMVSRQLARYHHCIDRIFLWMMAGIGIVEAVIHNLLQQTEIGNVFRVKYRHFLFDQIQNSAHICMFVLQLQDKHTNMS